MIGWSNNASCFTCFVTFVISTTFIQQFWWFLPKYGINQPANRYHWTWNSDKKILAGKVRRWISVAQVRSFTVGVIGDKLNDKWYWKRELLDITVMYKLSNAIPYIYLGHNCLDHHVMSPWRGIVFQNTGHLWWNSPVIGGLSWQSSSNEGCWFSLCY